MHLLSINIPYFCMGKNIYDSVNNFACETYHPKGCHIEADFYADNAARKNCSHSERKLSFETASNIFYAKLIAHQLKGSSNNCF
jgi:hypothetical protein